MRFLRPILLLSACVAAMFAACSQEQGETCREDNDCGSGLMCCKPSFSVSGRGACEMECTAAVVDAGPVVDAGATDAAAVDASSDAASLDAAPLDAAVLDAAPVDASGDAPSLPDASDVDAATADDAGADAMSDEDAGGADAAADAT